MHPCMHVHVHTHAYPHTDSHSSSCDRAKSPKQLCDFPDLLYAILDSSIKSLQHWIQLVSCSLLEICDFQDTTSPPSFSPTSMDNNSHSPLLIPHFHHVLLEASECLGLGFHFSVYNLWLQEN